MQDADNLGWKLAAVLRGPPEPMLDNHYRRAGLTEETRTAPGSVRAGDRAPDAPLRPPDAGPSCLFDVFRGSHATMVAFGEQAASASRAVLDLYPADHAPRLFDVRRDSPDTAQALGRIYDVAADEQVVFLVRPDGYIGLAADRHVGQYLQAHLDRITAPH